MFSFPCSSNTGSVRVSSTSLSSLPCLVNVVVVVASGTTAVILTTVAITNILSSWEYLTSSSSSSSSSPFGKVALIQWIAHLRTPWTRPILLRQEKTPKKEENRTDDEQRRQQQQSREVMLVIVPEVAVRSEAYVPLAKLLQGKARTQNMILHVGIVRFGWMNHLCGRSDIVGHADVLANISKLLGKQQSNHKILDRVFVLGHGRGADLAMVTAPYTGYIRYGSTGNDNNHHHRRHHSMDVRTLSTFPKPCLTMLGDRDGRIPYVQLADLLEDLDESQQRQQQEHEVPIPKPILLLPGLNHGCIVDTTLARDRTGRNDLPLRDDTTDEIASDQVSCVAINFVRIILDDEVGGLKELQKLTQHTQRRLKSYRTLIQRETMIDLARNIQQAIYHSRTGPPPNDPTNTSTSNTTTTITKMPCTVTVQFVTSVLDFAFAKPQIGDSYVRVFLYKQGPLRNKDNGKVILWSDTWAIKCKSQAALRVAFHNDTSGSEQGPEDFSDVFQTINRQTFDRVLHHVVTDTERDRYQKHGLKLDFGADCELMSSKVKKKNPLTWISSDLLLTPNDDGDGWMVSTPSAYTTSSEQLPVKFRGMHYGKILSPAQCYEWIVSGCWRMMAENNGI